MGEIHELSRVIGSLEQAVQDNSRQNQRLCERLDELENGIKDLSRKISDVSVTISRVDALEVDFSSLKKLRDRAIIVLALCGIGGGSIGAGAGGTAAKILKEIVK